MTARNATHRRTVLFMSLSALLPATAVYATEETNTAVDLAINLRYRTEYVEQSSFGKNALASTLRSRMTLKGAVASQFNWFVEADDVRAVQGTSYNSTENGVIDRPVVADMEGTDLNRIGIAWNNEEIDIQAGRLRINHGSQRFIGGVAWRQNEQTYDGARLQWNAGDALKIDLSYVSTIHRIFGPDDGAQPADWEGDHIFARGSIDTPAGLTIEPFYYRLDIDSDPAFSPALTTQNSTSTYGIEARWPLPAATLHAGYAEQRSIGQNPLDFKPSYHRFMLELPINEMRIELGYESLGSNNGQGFRTPLSTLHKFQGWADAFLTTPSAGVQDMSVALNGTMHKTTWRAVGHHFRSAENGTRLGNEFDFDIRWSPTPQTALQFRYARFSANTNDGAALPDLQKLWFIVEVSLP